MYSYWEDRTYARLCEPLWSIRPEPSPESVHYRGALRLCREAWYGKLSKSLIYSVSYFNLGALSGGAKPTKAPPWRRDRIRLNCQLVTKLEMMHILQAQVWSCISEHQGCHIKKRNGKLMMHQKVSWIKQVEIGHFEIWLRKSIKRL